MITASFNNTQGEEVTDGLVFIGDADFSQYANKSFSSDKGVTSEHGTGNNTLRYRVFYWKSQAAYDAGHTAFILDSAFIPSIKGEADYRSIEEKLGHNVQDLDSTYLSLSAEAMAEKHLIEVVFA